MKKKVLLMGKSGSGKTSMRSIIFANCLADNTGSLGATIEVEHSRIKFLGNLILNLWDCGGQQVFMENYFTRQRDNIFKNVEVLIYVFDVDSRDEELRIDLEYYQTCLNAICEHSSSAQIFCLIHKIDLVQDHEKQKIFSEREKTIINMTKPAKCMCFMSSIWDETLYKAWSSIMYKMIPNVREIDESLKKFGDVMECDEVILFERATFLTISSYERVLQKDITRREKVSNIIKKFQLSCNKLASQFKFMEIKNSMFAMFVDIITENSYIMIVMSDTTTPTVAVTTNIKNAQKHFEILEKEAYQESARLKFKELAIGF